MNRFFGTLFDSEQNDRYNNMAEEMRPSPSDHIYRKRSGNDPYKKETTHQRDNIFSSNLLYYSKCIELEKKVDKLEQANRFLTNQITSFMAMPPLTGKSNKIRELSKNIEKEIPKFPKNLIIDSQDKSINYKHITNGIEALYGIVERNKIFRKITQNLEEEKKEIKKLILERKHIPVLSQVLRVSIYALLAVESPEQVYGDMLASLNKSQSPKSRLENSFLFTENSKKSKSNFFSLTPLVNPISPPQPGSKFGQSQDFLSESYMDKSGFHNAIIKDFLDQEKKFFGTDSNKSFEDKGCQTSFDSSRDKSELDKSSFIKLGLDRSLNC